MFFNWAGDKNGNLRKDKFLVFFLLSGAFSNGVFELNKILDLTAKNKLAEKKQLVDGNLGFDDLIANEGGKGRKFIRERKIKEIIAEIIAPNEKNFDLLKL